MPSLVHDLAAVLTILTAAVLSLGWLVSRFARREERATVGGYIRTAIVHMIIRPDVPITEDIARIAAGFIGLLVAAVIFVWNMNGDFGLVRIVQHFVLAAMIVVAFLLVLQTARLFWKIDYIRRVHGDDGARADLDQPEQPGEDGGDQDQRQHTDPSG